MITIGSHTVTHRRLALLNEEEVKKELNESKETLENILKTEIDSLAFPYGNYNARVVELAVQAGYKKLFTILPDSPFSPKDKILTGRISVSVNDWPAEYFLKLMGAYNRLPIAVKLKAKLLKYLPFNLSNTN